MDDEVHSLSSTLETTGIQILGTKQAALVFFTIQVYDHILTLPEEIEFIWHRRFTPVTILFFMNRYYSLAFFCIYITALLSPLFTPSVCERFAPFLPFAGGIVLTFLPNTVLALRVYALYHKNRLVASLLIIYLIAELSVALWIYCTPGSHPLSLPPAVQNNDTFHICIEEVADSLGNLRSAAFQIMQTIYDTGIFLLISCKVILDTRRPRYGRSIQSIIAGHGVIYYAALFSANFTWAMMILFAPASLKFTAAIPTLILACTAVNRITISLRRFGSPVQGTTSSESMPHASSQLPKGSSNNRTYPDGAFMDPDYGVETFELNVIAAAEDVEPTQHLDTR